MTKYHLYVNCCDFGVIEADDEWDALESYAKEAGYSDVRALYADRVKSALDQYDDYLMSDEEKGEFDIYDYMTLTHCGENESKIEVRFPERGSSLIQDEYFFVTGDDSEEE